MLAITHVGALYMPCRGVQVLFSPVRCVGAAAPCRRVCVMSLSFCITYFYTACFVLPTARQSSSSVALGYGAARRALTVHSPV